MKKVLYRVAGALILIYTGEVIGKHDWAFWTNILLVMGMYFLYATFVDLYAEEFHREKEEKKDGKLIATQIIEMNELTDESIDEMVEELREALKREKKDEG